MQMAEEKLILKRKNGQAYIPSPTKMPVHAPQIYQAFTTFKQVISLSETYSEWDSKIREEYNKLTGSNLVFIFANLF